MIKFYQFACLLFLSFTVEAMDADEPLKNGTIYLETNAGLEIFSDQKIKSLFPHLSWLDVGNEAFSFPPLIIKKMNNKVGDGLFAGADIDDSTLVFIYTGQVTPGRVSSFYGLYNDKINCTIDAERVGNAARFAQHAPENLQHFAFDDSVDVKNLATANVSSCGYFGTFEVFCANRFIRKGELIVYDYGRDYVINFAIVKGQQLELFYKDGTVVPRELVTPQSIAILVSSSINNIIILRKTRKGLAEMLDSDPSKVFWFGTPSEMMVSRKTLLEKVPSHDEVWTFLDESSTTCAGCGEVIVKNKQRCARCKVARYCSKECQISDWDHIHKKICSTLKDGSQ